MKTQSQKEQIFYHMLEGKRVTHRVAEDLFGCSRLASIVHRIERQTGIPVERDYRTSKSKFGVKYFMEYWIKNVNFNLYGKK
jgi:hypothetical protein